MKYIPFHSCIKLPPILQFDHFSASPLNSDDSRQYPMHMRLNGASKTLIQLIEGVFPIFDLIQCKNTVPRQQSDRYLTPEPPMTAAPPPNESAESADEVGCGAARWPLWMAAVHWWMRPVDGSPMVALSCGSFDRCFSGPKLSAQKLEVFSRPFADTSSHGW